MSGSENLRPGPGLGKERVREIKMGFDELQESPDLDVREEDRMAIMCVQVMEKLSGRRMLNRFNSLNYFRKHRAFVEACNGIMPEISEESNTDRMVLTSELLALHYLLVNDGIDLLYDQRMRDHSPDNLQDEVEEEETKIDLLADYLANMREKNKTILLAEKGVVPVGFEYEYGDLSQRLSSVTKRHRLPDDAEAVLQWALAEDRKIQKEYPLSSFSRLGGYDDYPDEIGVNEIRTRPTFSPREELRKFVHLRKAGGLEGKISVHATFAGVELRPDHTEFMNTMAVMTAAGLMRGKDKITPKMIEMHKKTGHPIVWERYSKHENFGRLNSDRENVNYFPFFRRRRGTEPIDVDSKSYASGVEVRLPGFGEQDFAQLVRTMTYTWLSANAVAAVQKLPEERDDNETKLASFWDGHMQEWQSVLENHGVKVPDKSEYYTQLSEDDEVELNWSPDVRMHAGFTLFINELLVKMAEDEGFRQESFACMTRFNKKAKEILDY